MAKLQWDKAGEKTYETGVDHGVLYPRVGSLYPTGVVWNGLTTVTNSPSGAEASPQYADNQKYLNLVSAEEFAGTIEAFTYPDEFEACDGTKELLPGVTIGQQNRQEFGFAYRTKVGNDTEGQDYAYKIHLVYGALAAPSERAYATVNDSPEAMALSWEFSTTPVEVTDAKPTATLVIDSRSVPAAALTAIEDVLYGTAANPARLPLPDEVVSIISAAGGSSAARISSESDATA